MMMRGRTFWGVLFLLAGALLLLDNLGLLPASAGRLFWPLLIILFGVWILLRGSWVRSGGKTEARRELLSGASRASFRLQHGAGRLRVSGPSDADELFNGEFVAGVDARVDRRGETAEVTLSVPDEGWWDLPWSGGRGFDWNLRLTGEVPLSLILETGAGETALELTDLQVTELNIKTGASSSEVRLPAHAGQTEVRVEAGAASVTLDVPPGVAARIHSNSGLVDLQIDRSRFPASGSSYESPEFESAENRVNIEVKAGVGAIRIR